jgi:hypothetical protein
MANVPHILKIIPAKQVVRNRTIRVKYTAGWTANDAPPDLREACLELVIWKYGRHKEKRIGTVVKQNGRQYESGMPERVKELLAPYKRKVL